MAFSHLYAKVQTKTAPISTRWLRECAMEHSVITRVKEQWSSIIEGTAVRGFYIEGPIGPPIPLKDHEVLITIARNVCTGPLGDHWRRFIYTKELMHVFDEDDEKADTREKFDLQIERFGDPDIPMSKQFRAEQKAFWRALMALCPEVERKRFKALQEKHEISHTVIAAALRIPVGPTRELLRDDFDVITSKLK